MLTMAVLLPCWPDAEVPAVHDGDGFDYCPGSFDPAYDAVTSLVK
jgi:hypothetical protein